MAIFAPCSVFNRSHTSWARHDYCSGCVRNSSRLESSFDKASTQVADLFLASGRGLNKTAITVTPNAERSSCPLNCTRSLDNVGYRYWSPRPVTATITAETVVYVINKRTNRTRTEIITNTALDLASYKPTSLDNDGTQFQVVTVPASGSYTTTTLYVITLIILNGRTLTCVGNIRRLL